MMIAKKVARVSGDAVFFVGEQFLHGHAIDEKAKITINGKPAALTDIRADDMVALDGQPSVVVEVTRQGEFNPAPVPEMHSTEEEDEEVKDEDEEETDEDES